MTDQDIFHFFAKLKKDGALDVLTSLLKEKLVFNEQQYRTLIATRRIDGPMDLRPFDILTVREQIFTQMIREYENLASGLPTAPSDETV